ncbi:hypothetical protein J4434_07005 [Candidatus Woesearchaeota archaeon]|nr:hypothetical protein [Candidatus Woesearchaeota archaeon]
MEKKILKNIVENKAKFVPLLFTAKQVNLIEKYLQNMKKGKDKETQKMTPTEKTILYSTIKKKVDALMLLKEEFHIKGQNMIPERVEKAKEILKAINKEKAFISGTFLFAQDYNDIDIYVISNKRKQFHQKEETSDKELHFIYITENDLKKPIFNSASQYCVANFFIETPQANIEKPAFSDLVMTYEMAVTEIMNSEIDKDEDQKTSRELIFEYNLQVKNIVLDSYTLSKRFNEVISLKMNDKISIINMMAKELLIKLYSPTYLYNELTKFVKQLKKDIEFIDLHDHLLIFVEVLGGVKDACRRTKS